MTKLFKITIFIIFLAFSIFLLFFQKSEEVGEIKTSYVQEKEKNSQTEKSEEQKDEIDKIDDEKIEENNEEKKEEIKGNEDWKTYINEKYNYSFDYPKEYTFGPCNTKPCNPFINEEKEGDYVILQGDVSNNGWPNMEVSHYETEFYNPPNGADIIEWLKDKSPVKENIPNEINFEIGGIDAIKAEIPKSAQSYSLWEIYFIKNNDLFNISMTDVETLEAQIFYNLILSSFEFLE